MIGIEREREGQRHKRREKQAPCRKPDAGLDPGTLGSYPETKADAQSLSHPETKADAQLLCHPGIPKTLFLVSGIRFLIRC